MRFADYIVINRIEQLDEAEENYFNTAKAVLSIANRAYDIFQSSEVEEKRHLIKLVLSNVKIEKENLVFSAHKPFDEILNATHRKSWRGLADRFINRRIEFNFSLSHIQTAFSELNIQAPCSA